MVPEYSYSPVSSFRKVVFPLPFLPINPSFQSVSIWKETFSKTGSKQSSYVKLRFLTCISDSIDQPPL